MHVTEFISLHDFRQRQSALFGLFGPGSVHRPPLVGGTLIDGFGSKPIHNSIIIIEGEKIKAIGRMGEITIPPGAKIISTEGMSVMPGLWDMHVHMMINGHSDYS